MTHQLRRKLLAAGAAAPALIGLAPRHALANEKLRGTTLRVATYGGSWRDNVEKYLCARIAEAGVKIDYVIGNPEANLAKLIAASRQRMIPFDVMDGSPLFYGQLVKAGLLERIDYSQLPSARNLPSWVLQEYQIEPNWTTDCVVYNPARFREAGIKPPERYTDLLDPKLKGRVAYPDPAHVQHWGVTVALAREAGGSEADMSGALKIVRQMEPAYYYTSSVDLSGRFGSGEIWAAPWGGSWAVRLKESGQEAAAAYMKIGDKQGVLWPATKMILKGTPNLPASQMYLDAYLAEESSYGFCMAVGNVPVSSAARKRMAQDPIRRENLLLTDAQLENAMRVRWQDIDDRAWRDAWNRGIKR
ncbi:MAG: PotD/PotF family extracellular solute-binding protein [Burkholderiaceae bacterium]